MFGHMNQLSRYAAAAGRPSNKNVPTKALQSYARRSALGKQHTHQRSASMEGYQGGRSTWLQPNNSGYLNKANQGARHRSPLRNASLQAEMDVSAPTSGPVVAKNVFDYRYVHGSGGSPQRLSQLTELNRMF